MYGLSIECARLLECQVHSGLNVSNHRLLHVTLELRDPIQITGTRVSLHIPNLRDASDEKKVAMAMQLGVRIEGHKDELAAGDANDINVQADTLTRWTFECASGNNARRRFTKC